MQNDGPKPPKTGHTLWGVQVALGSAPGPSGHIAGARRRSQGRGPRWQAGGRHGAEQRQGHLEDAKVGGFGLATAHAL